MESRKSPRRVGAAGLGLLVLLLAGCGSVRPPTGTAPGSAVVMPAARPAPGGALPAPERQAEPAAAGGAEAAPDAATGAELPLIETGIASWYGKPFHGRRTASGERFDMNALTAAHKTLPMPSYARVRNPANGREVVVRVNDRGPFRSGRIIDLSRAAARQLGIDGLAKVEVQALLSEDLCAGRWGPPPDKRACTAGDGAR